MLSSCVIDILCTINLYISRFTLCVFVWPGKSEQKSGKGQGILKSQWSGSLDL